MSFNPEDFKAPVTVKDIYVYGDVELECWEDTIISSQFTLRRKDEGTWTMEFGPNNYEIPCEGKVLPHDKMVSIMEFVVQVNHEQALAIEKESAKPESILMPDVGLIERKKALLIQSFQTEEWSIKYDLYCSCGEEAECEQGAHEIELLGILDKEGPSEFRLGSNTFHGKAKPFTCDDCAVERSIQRAIDRSNID